MKKYFAMLALILALPSLAEIGYEKEVPFLMIGSMTHFFGGPKSAEADMWAQALHVCDILTEGENNTLMLNRLSEVRFSEKNFTSFAEARFVCKPAGSGE